MTTSCAPVLLKLSGEALKGSAEGIFDPVILHRVGAEIAAASRPVAVVVGGGNIVRGRDLGAVTDRPARGDYMGMMATVLNALALRESLETAGAEALVVAPYAIPNVTMAYDRDRVLAALGAGRTVLFAGGTGHPFFTTDTAAALRAVEIGAAVLLKGSTVDGIYSADPRRDPEAKRFEHLSFDEAVAGGYGVMDQTAFTLCRSHTIPIRVFDMTPPGAIATALGPHPTGTLVG